MFKKLGNDVVLPIMNSKGLSVRKYFFNTNNFIEDCFLNRLLDTNDKFLIERILINKSHADNYLAKFSDLDQYSDSGKANKSPEERLQKNHHQEDEENRRRSQE